MNKLHKDPMEEPKLLNLRQVSKRYNYPLSTIRRYASERRIPLLKIGKRVLVNVVEFEAWLEKHKIEVVDGL